MDCLRLSLDPLPSSWRNVLMHRCAVNPLRPVLLIVAGTFRKCPWHSACSPGDMPGDKIDAKWGKSSWAGLHILSRFRPCAWILQPVTWLLFSHSCSAACSKGSRIYRLNISSRSACSMHYGLVNYRFIFFWQKNKKGPFKQISLGLHFRCSINNQTLGI